MHLGIWLKVSLNHTNNLKAMDSHKFKKSFFSFSFSHFSWKVCVVVVVQPLDLDVEPGKSVFIYHNISIIWKRWAESNKETPPTRQLARSNMERYSTTRLIEVLSTCMKLKRETKKMKLPAFFLFLRFKWLATNIMESETSNLWATKLIV